MKTYQQLNIDGIIFDYGGTLDTNGRHWANVLWEGYQHALIDINESVFRDAYVYGERSLAKNPIIQPNDNFHTLLLKKLREEFDYLIANNVLTEQDAHRRKDAEQEIADWCYLYVCHEMERNTRKLLKELSGKYPLVMVTNFYGNMNSVLEDFDIRKYFLSIVESAVVGVRKPNPSIYQMGIEQLNMAANQVAVVGDSYDKDIMAASSIGCQTIWLKGEEWTKSEHDETIPSIIITEIDSLTSIL